MNYEFKNDNDSDLSNFQDKESYFKDKLNNRAKTAPPRPPNVIEEFRNSGIFNCIEKALSYLENFSHPYSQSFDMDSTDGQVFCRKFLQQLEKLQILAKVKTSSRLYRKQFSNAYRILYKENELCYLTEILDSAQESVPCLYVNGEKYCFTEEVIKIGKQLFQNFLELQGVLRKGFLSNSYESNFLDIEDFENDLKIILEKFDNSWVAYENLYVKELMIIEAEARNQITQAIQYEQQLTKLEQEQQATQKFINPNLYKIQKLKTEIIKLMGQINSVANMEGKGRDDLNYTILQSAEEILENYSVCESKSIRVLAQNVVNSFEQFRKLMRKYSKNIEVVDPQLRNNPDLLQVLMSYESFWEKGKRYFLDKQKTSQLVFFSNVIEGLCEKHKTFQEKLEYCDTEIFIMIPMIMILRKINQEDKNICSYYLPELLESNSKYSTSLNKLIQIFQSIKKEKFSNNKENCKSFLNTSYQNFQKQKKFKTLLKSKINSLKKSKILSNILYNFFEKLIIAEESDQQTIIKEMQYEHVSSNITEALRIMRILSIEIQRKNPVEWNEFMDIALQHTLTNDIFEEAFEIFTEGCKNKYCLSPDCYNFIYKNNDEVEDIVTFILEKIQQNNLMIFCSDKYLISRQYKRQNKDIIILFQQIYSPDSKSIEYEYSLTAFKQQNKLDDTSLQQTLSDFYNCLFCIKKSQAKIDKKLKNFFLQTLLTLEDVLIKEIQNNAIDYRRVVYFLQNENFDSCINLFNFEEFIENLKASMIEIKIMNVYLNKLQQSELNCLHMLLEIMKINFNQKMFQRDLYFYEDILEKEEIYKEVLKYLVDIYTQSQVDHPLRNYGLGLMMWQCNIKFLDYSFIFTSKQKFHMIQWEKKQCEEIEKRRLQQAIMLNPFLTEHGSYELYFNLKVKRDSIVQDTFNQLQDKFSQYNIKKILKIEFVGEIGQDTGGLKREFFYQISKQIILQEKLVEKVNDYFHWLTKTNCLQEFFNLGQIFGLALLNSEVLTFNLPLVFYKCLLKNEYKFELEDLKEIDYQLYKSLTNLKKLDLNEQELDYIYFDYDGNEYKKEDCLINNSNKEQFVMDYVETYLTNLLEKENFQEFRFGFYSISKFYILKIFDSHDLSKALQGEQNINFEKIQKYTKYFQWKSKDKTIIFLWEILNELEQNEQKQFLQFLTGSTKLPLQGEEALNIKIKLQQDTDYLPIAQTCSNTLFLRQYNSKEELKKHIMLCIQGDQGFYLA